MTLDEVRIGRTVQIVHTDPDFDLHAKARAIGLRAGRTACVMSRNGRMLLVRVGDAHITITSDVASRIEVR
ncbi:MAG: FeoA family protein [Anaerolineae bacterium]|nr:FeoA family protein [Anaerolineae bacterium]